MIQDYAEKEKAIAKALEDLKANFYCELCDKQYLKHQEFDNHINSYDHAHKQRLKELKQREFARNVASKSWKDEKKQERALRRLHQLAELRKQSECGPGSGPKFRATTVTAEVQQQEKGISEKDYGNGNHYIFLSHEDNAPNKAPKRSQDLLVTKERLHIRNTQFGLNSASDYSNQRAGVSFCFSKKAQLKLESSASVFSDNTEESNDRENPPTHKVKQTLETLRSPNPLPGNTTLDIMEERHTEYQTDKKMQESKDNCLEFNQISSAHSTTDDQCFPLTVPSGSLENSALDKELRESSLGSQSETESNELNKTNCFAVSDISLKGGQAERDSRQMQRKTLIQETIQMEKGTEIVYDTVTVKTEDSQNNAMEADDTYCVENVYGGCDELNKKVGPFLNVLNKDGSTMLKWPSELLLYTKTEPYISYSCNPLYFDFKHSKNRQNAHDDVQNSSTEICQLIVTADENNDRENDHSNLDSIELQTPGHPENKFNNQTKPKSTKHYKACKTPNLKLEADNTSSSSCKHNVNSQLEPEACIESTWLNMSLSKGVSTKRYRLGKQSLKDETSNDSDLIDQSQRNIKHLLPTVLGKNQKQTFLNISGKNYSEETSPDHIDLKANNDHLKCNLNVGVCERKGSTKSSSEKSGSWCSFSDLDTDTEGGSYRSERCSSSCGSSYKSSSKRDTSYSRTHGSTSSCSKTFSSYRSSDDSSSGDTAHCSAREHDSHQDYKSAHRHKKRKYSTSSEDSSEIGINFSHSMSSNRKRNRRQWAICRRSRSSYSSSTSDQSTDQHSCSRLRYSSSRKRHHSDKSRSKSRHSGSKSRSIDMQSNRERVSFFSRDQMCSFDFESSNSMEVAKDIGIQSRCQTSYTAVSDSRKHARTSPNASTVEQFVKKSPDNNDKNIIGKKHNSTSSLPLIGKLPAVKRNVKREENNKLKSSNREAATNRTPVDPQEFQSPLPNAEGKSISMQSKNPKSDTLQTERQLQDPKGREELDAMPRAFSSEACVFSIFSTEKESIMLPDPGQNYPQGQWPKESAFQAGTHYAEEKQAQMEEPSKCVSPPLTEQPITFTPDEIDKYRLLQLQAQQHMQQQLLGKHVKLLPAHSEVPGFSPVPAFQSVPLPQPGPLPSIQHTLLQQRAVASFASALNHHPSHQPLTHIHPVPQPHFAPISLSPIAPALFPAHPAALLAGHPFHFIPASTFHPTHLALHPVPHSSLLPALLTPSSAMAAAAASGLHLHPLFHPLFPAQDLQHHSGPSS
ncbi:G patch domain-containing protein 8 isoform X2 [Lepisosteus oculatus]|uniref:G patch domain-containing protein 8 isoform X2 n=1 Tax=Lepisosteus oculatus TaxID=7918 RepID=UPI00073FE76B|nr:PREDICTED: zinc finger protein 804B isoform X2 [Lepisosteus oculatus]